MNAIEEIFVLSSYSNISLFWTRVGEVAHVRFLLHPTNAICPPLDPRNQTLVPGERDGERGGESWLGGGLFVFHF